MPYDPKIKNLPYLISDLRELLSEQIDAQTVYSKISELDYKFDSTDGFEDILDTIRPFLKSYKNTFEHKSRLKTIVEMLVVEAPLQDIEKFCSGNGGSMQKQVLLLNVFWFVTLCFAIGISYSMAKESYHSVGLRDGEIVQKERLIADLKKIKNIDPCSAKENINLIELVSVKTTGLYVVPTSDSGFQFCINE